MSMTEAGWCTIVLLSAGLVGCRSQPATRADTDQSAPAATWRDLFNGRDLEGWRGFEADTPPAGWEVVDGTLYHNADHPGPGGDLMTVDEFDDFELTLEWKIAPGGNSGIMFRVTQDDDAPWKTATEMQVLDNFRHPDGRNPLTSAGANYGLYAPTADVTRGVGEWNAVRILAAGPHVEYWLNGTKVVEFELWSEDWERRVAASKFAQYPRYGRARRGHLDLQDHGDRVWYRNIRLRPIRTNASAR